MKHETFGSLLHDFTEDNLDPDFGVDSHLYLDFDPAEPDCSSASLFIGCELSITELLQKVPEAVQELFETDLDSATITSDNVNTFEIVHLEKFGNFVRNKIRNLYQIHDSELINIQVFFGEKIVEEKYRVDPQVELEQMLHISVSVIIDDETALMNLPLEKFRTFFNPLITFMKDECVTGSLLSKFHEKNILDEANDSPNLSKMFNLYIS